MAARYRASKAHHHSVCAFTSNASRGQYHLGGLDRFFADGWIDGWTDGRMDAWMNISTCVMYVQHIMGTLSWND